MPRDFMQRQPQLSFEQFDAFREERPKEEKWELIDGVPVETHAWSIPHQRICANIAESIDARAAMANLGWSALLHVSVKVPGNDRVNLVPDVTAVDAVIELDQIYAERFYFVAEVLSASNRPETLAGSDRPIVLAAKIDFYKQHEHCRGVLIVRQDRVEADLFLRAANWTSRELRSPADRIVIPDIDDIGPLARLYRLTPHWRAEWAAL